MTAFNRMLTGRLEPHSKLTHPRIEFGAFLRAGYTDVIPATVDYMSGVNAWPMYGNDRLSDCTAAAAGHAEEAWSQYGQSKAVMVTDADVVRFYEQSSGYNPADPSTDKGAVMQDALGVWRSIGIAGHRILGFAELDPTNPPECVAGLYWFGALYVGVTITKDALAQTQAGLPWTYNQGGNNTVAGKHAIHIGRSASGVWEATTWGQKQLITQGWWEQYVDEAWLPISKEWLNSSGVSPTHLNGQAMNARFTELTKQPGPFPTITPTPPPAPPPTPPATDPDVRLIQECWPWATGTHFPGSGASKAAAALLVWRNQKGK